MSVPLLHENVTMRITYALSSTSLKNREVVAFLASGKASFMVGAIVMADGGSIAIRINKVSK